MLPLATRAKAKELYETMARELAFNPRQSTGSSSLTREYCNFPTLVARGTYCTALYNDNLRIVGPT